MTHMEVIPSKALAQHIAVLGKTGAGKTHTAKWIIEQHVAAGARVCILDPIKSDHWGLTSSATGKSAGLPFSILGGPKAHAPLPPRSGQVIGSLVATGELPLSIIDMAEFTPRELSDWYLEFAETLIRKMQGVLILVMEEADIFAPKERLGADQENMRLHWSSRLARTGRSKGIRLIGNCTRVQKIHNDFLGSCETLIAHRFTTPADRKPIIEWLSINAEKSVAKEIESTLSTLKNGEGWVCYPEGGHIKRAQFPRIHTYDNSKTPEHGDSDHNVKTAAIDIEKLRGKLGEAVKEAEANDPKLLRAKIAELSKQLSKSASVVQKPDQKAVETAISMAIQARDYHWQKQIAAIEKERDSIIGTLKTKMGKAAAILNVNGEAEPKVNFQPQNIPTAIPRSAPPERGVAAGNNLRTSPQHSAGTAVASRPAKQPVKNAGNYAAVDTDEPQHLGKAERSILTALYWLRGESITPAKVGFYANYTVEGGSFKNAIGRLRTLGLVRNWALTAEGETAAEQIVTEDKPTGPELRDWLGRKLGAAENKLLDALCEAYPQRLTDEELGQASGYEHTGGSYKNAIGRLRTLEAAEGYARDGGTKAADVFFE